MLRPSKTSVANFEETISGSAKTLGPAAPENLCAHRTGWPESGPSKCWIEIGVGSGCSLIISFWFWEVVLTFWIPLVSYLTSLELSEGHEDSGCFPLPVLHSCWYWHGWRKHRTPQLKFPQRSPRTPPWGSPIVGPSEKGDIVELRCLARE